MPFEVFYRTFIGLQLYSCSISTSTGPTLITKTNTLLTPSDKSNARACQTSTPSQTLNIAPPRIIQLLF